MLKPDEEITSALMTAKQTHPNLEAICGGQKQLQPLGGPQARHPFSQQIQQQQLPGIRTK